ncbi:hypothetical protein AURDEDRAFT_169866 [Auricularia subglabra TFB-10046 SS5]|nr:hypothetical protein AURDEDRAFT_169866 [Auricularia subglabra TFB-10046 SS5]
MLELSGKEYKVLTSETVPRWFPTPLHAAANAALTIDRQLLDNTGRAYPVPRWARREGQLHRVPVITWLASASQKNAADALSRWPGMRRYVLWEMMSNPLSLMRGLSGGDWHEMLKGKVKDNQATRLVSEIGLDAAFDVDDGEKMPRPVRLEGVNNLDQFMDKLPVNSSGKKDVWKNIVEVVTEKQKFELCDLPPPTASDQERLEHPSTKILVWDIVEHDFRHTLVAFDMYLRSIYPKHPLLAAEEPQARYRRVQRCWGADGMMVKDENWLTSQLPERRAPSLFCFAKLMSTWPNTKELLAGWSKYLCDETLAVPDPAGDEFRALEAEAWRCYAQMFYYYRQRAPVLPFMKPVF